MDGARKLEGAEELTQIVAHDLRNPLACIQGYAQLLASRDMEPQDREKLAERVLACSRFMERIIEDLLDAAAAERGGLRMNRGRVDLGDLVRKSLEAMEPTATSRGAILSLRGAERGRLVEGNATRLQQAVQNLVANAIKHVPQGSGRVDVRLHELGEDLVIEVADNGDGIAPEHLERVFEKFFSADAERSRGSLGLGLFIAREIVHAHGGTLWARSEGRGRGACFYLRLPKEAQAAATRATSPPCRAAEARLPLLTARRPRLGLALAAAALLAVCAGLGRRRQAPPPGALSASAAPLR